MDYRKCGFYGFYFGVIVVDITVFFTLFLHTYKYPHSLFTLIIKQS